MHSVLQTCVKTSSPHLHVPYMALPALCTAGKSMADKNNNVDHISAPFSHCHLHPPSTPSPCVWQLQHELSVILLLPISDCTASRIRSKASGFSASALSNTFMSVVTRLHRGATAVCKHTTVITVTMFQTAVKTMTLFQWQYDSTYFWGSFHKLLASL